MKTLFDIQNFKNEAFGTIRTLVNENGETFFVGSDVAAALGYNKTRNAVAAHVSPEDRATALIQGPNADQGLAQDRKFHYYGLGGVKKQRPYLVWTAAGMEFIREMRNESTNL